MTFDNHIAQGQIDFWQPFPTLWRGVRSAAGGWPGPGVCETPFSLRGSAGWVACCVLEVSGSNAGYPHSRSFPLVTPPRHLSLSQGTTYQCSPRRTFKRSLRARKPSRASSLRSSLRCHARVLERVAKSQFVPGRCGREKSSASLKTLL